MSRRVSLFVAAVWVLLAGPARATGELEFDGRVGEAFRQYAQTIADAVGKKETSAIKIFGLLMSYQAGQEEVFDAVKDMKAANAYLEKLLRPGRQGGDGGGNAALALFGAEALGAVSLATPEEAAKLPEQRAMRKLEEVARVTATPGVHAQLAIYKRMIADKMKDGPESEKLMNQATRHLATAVRMLVSLSRGAPKGEKELLNDVLLKPADGSSEAARRYSRVAEIGRRAMDSRKGRAAKRVAQLDRELTKLGYGWDYIDTRYVPGEARQQPKAELLPRFEEGYLQQRFEDYAKETARIVGRRRSSAFDVFRQLVGYQAFAEYADLSEADLKVANKLLEQKLAPVWQGGDAGGNGKLAYHAFRVLTTIDSHDQEAIQKLPEQLSMKALDEMANVRNTPGIHSQVGLFKLMVAEFAETQASSEQMLQEGAVHMATAARKFATLGKKGPKNDKKVIKEFMPREVTNNHVSKDAAKQFNYIAKAVHTAMNSKNGNGNTRADRLDTRMRKIGFEWNHDKARYQRREARVGQRTSQQF